MNPCPCGFFGTDKCFCRETDVAKYQNKISGPLLDRIDLQVELNRLSTDERFAQTEKDVSPKLRAKVEAARCVQQKRFAGTDIPHNAAIPAGQVRSFCNFSSAAFELYKEMIDKHSLSTRSMDRLAKVSRTVADLEGSTTTDECHLETAGTFVIGGILRESG